MESADQAIHSIFSGTAPELHLLLGKFLFIHSDHQAVIKDSCSMSLFLAVELISNATVKNQESSTTTESRTLAKQALRFLRIKAAKVFITSSCTCGRSDQLIDIFYY